MATTTIIIPIPDDGVTTYQKAQVYRAADNGSGAPGAFSLLATPTLDPYNEQTSYTDTTGATDSWYHFRYTDTAVSVFSDYSDDVQAGTYTVKTWLMQDIPDADLTDQDWDNWKDMAFQELASNWLGRPSDILEEVPSSDTDEWTDLPAAIRKVIRVDVYYSGRYVSMTDKWYQMGRKLRLVEPDPTLTYKIYGISEIRDWGDLDDELFMLVYWYMRLKYIDKRIAERLNFKMYLNADKNTDAAPIDFVRMREQAQQEYVSRLVQARQSAAIPANQP